MVVSQDAHLDRPVSTVLEGLGEWIVFDLEFCYL